MLKLNHLSGFGSGVSGAAVTGNGFISGGRNTPLGYHDITDRLVYATEVCAAHTDADLSLDMGEAAMGTSDTTTYGYVGGGYNDEDANYTTVDRFTFSTSTAAAHTDADIHLGRHYGTSNSDGNTYGYPYLGGYASSVNVGLSDRITFSTSVTAAHTDSDLAQGARGGTTNSDWNGTSSTYGYHLGGITSTTGHSKGDQGQRQTFSTGVYALHTDADVSVAKCYGNGLNDNSGIYGYLCGGNSGSRVDVTERLTFSTGVLALNTDSDVPVVTSGCGGHSSVTNGYLCGGTSGSIEDYIYKIVYSTGIFAASPIGTMSRDTNHPAGLSSVGV